MFKKVSWKVGGYSHLSGCLIGHRRDSAVRRVVSDTDTPKSFLDNSTTSTEGTVPIVLLAFPKSIHTLLDLILLGVTLGFPKTGALDFIGQIGRASCRERVFLTV